MRRNLPAGDLFPAVRGQPQPQPLDGLAALEVALDDFGNVACLDALVPHPFGVDDDRGAERAGAEAGGARYGGVGGEFRGLDGLAQGLENLDAALGLAAAHRVARRALVDADEYVPFDVFHGSLSLVRGPIREINPVGAGVKKNVVPGQVSKGKALPG